MGPLTRGFLASQGITTVTTFLSASAKEIATVLAEQTINTFFSARTKVNRWKRDVRQRQEARKKQIVGLHPAFGVLDDVARSFFNAMSIATPKDLLKYQGLARAYVKWRRDNNMSDMNKRSANAHVVRLRDYVRRQNESSTETVGDTIIDSVATDLLLLGPRLGIVLSRKESQLSRLSSPPAEKR
jgi:hypothetical protein